MHRTSLFSAEHRRLLSRLVAAWLSGDFGPAGDILDTFVARQPSAAWNPDPHTLPDPRLRHMAAIWESQRVDQALPHVSLCTPEAYGDLAQVMMVLDFWDDSTDLDYRHYGTELAEHAGGSQQGATVGQLAHHAPYSLLFASTYYATAAMRLPHYSEVVSAPKLVSTTWCRFLLPYVNDQQQIVAFACGNVPIPGLPTWPAVGGAPGRSDAIARGMRHEMETAARALVQVERNVRDILTYSPLAIMILAAGTERRYFANAPMAALVQRSHDELSHAAPASIFADVGLYRRVLAQAQEGKTVRDTETRLLRPSGEEVWVLMTTSAIEFDNNPCLAFWFYDITQRKQSEEALKRFSAIGQELSASLDIHTISRVLAQRLPEIASAERITVHLLDRTTNTVRRLGSGSENTKPFTLLRNHTAVATTIRDGVEVVQDDPTGLNVLHLPLTADGVTLGALSFATRPASAGGKLENSLLRSLATSISVALVNAEKTQALTVANAELERIARHDALTGVPNRRCFYETAGLELARAQRHGQPLAVLLIDIDFFKQVNDTHGHAAGDEVLRRVATHIASDLRPGDLLARLGGEEFGLLLPGVDSATAFGLAERVRHAVHALAIAHDTLTLHVTVSLGITDLQPADNNVDDLLKRADTALYQAKHAGRNRSVVNDRSTCPESQPAHASR